jgi:hypothetical protein
LTYTVFQLDYQNIGVSFMLLGGQKVILSDKALLEAIRVLELSSVSSKASGDFSLKVQGCAFCEKTMALLVQFLQQRQHIIKLELIDCEFTALDRHRDELAIELLGTLGRGLKKTAVEELIVTDTDNPPGYRIPGSGMSALAVEISDNLFIKRLCIGTGTEGGEAFCIAVEKSRTINRFELPFVKNKPTKDEDPERRQRLIARYAKVQTELSLRGGGYHKRKGGGMLSLYEAGLAELGLQEDASSASVASASTGVASTGDAGVSASTSVVSPGASASTSASPGSKSGAGSKA